MTIQWVVFLIHETCHLCKKQLLVLKTFVLDDQHKQEDVEHMKLDPNANAVPTTLREEDDEQCWTWDQLTCLFKLVQTSLRIAYFKERCYVCCFMSTVWRLFLKLCHLHMDNYGHIVHKVAFDFKELWTLAGECTWDWYWKKKGLIEFWTVKNCGVFCSVKEGTLQSGIVPPLLEGTFQKIQSPDLKFLN
jgi:hypothetical protein